MSVGKINLEQKFKTFADYWSPKLIGEVDEFDVKLAKLKGEFVWHHHEKEDELFLVTKGRLVIKLRDRKVVLNEGEMFIVPKGVEHMPVAEDECHVLLLERRGVVNTGNVRNERTVETYKKI
jgi:mannose-6-phosphate isomerase-like protein (cupin superfamily)